MIWLALFLWSETRNATKPETVGFFSNFSLIL